MPSPNAPRSLCDAASASMYLIEGDHLRHLASKGPSPDPVATVEAIPINRDSVSGRALLERQHDPGTRHARRGRRISAQLRSWRGNTGIVPSLVMPLYREGAPFGTILLRRNEVRSFNDREIALLQTFGDQAAIAHRERAPVQRDQGSARAAARVRRSARRDQQLDRRHQPGVRQDPGELRASVRRRSTPESTS